MYHKVKPIMTTCNPKLWLDCASYPTLKPVTLNFRKSCQKRIMFACQTIRPVVHWLQNVSQECFTECYPMTPVPCRKEIATPALAGDGWLFLLIVICDLVSQSRYHCCEVSRTC